MKQNSTASAKTAFLANLLKEGEHYAGILLGKDGAPDQHIILLPGQANDVAFPQAQEFAAKAGGELPTRREHSLLFANLKEEFESNWYWSSELHSDTRFAWNQYFVYGNQGYYYTRNKLRARAVRRVEV